MDYSEKNVKLLLFLTAYQEKIEKSKFLCDIETVLNLTDYTIHTSKEDLIHIFRINHPKLNVTDNQAYIASIAAGLMKAEGYYIPEPVLQLIAKHSVVHDKSLITDNPYFQTVHIDKKYKQGNFILRNRVCCRNEIMTYDCRRKSIFDENDCLYLGCFEEDISVPVLAQGDMTYMSITPNEIYTMQKDIDQATGRVLTLGLGLGYYAFMVARKPDVESVTVVELSDDVIDLYNNYIATQFPEEVRNKIHIIHSDAYNYLSTLEDGVFDYCFADIWVGPSELGLYLKMCRYAKFKQMKMGYWIEQTMIGILYQMIFTYLSFMIQYKIKGGSLNEAMGMLKAMFKDYKSPNNDEIYEQEMLNFDEQFRNYFKTHSFTYKGLNHLFTDDGMKELLYNL